MHSGRVALLVGFGTLQLADLVLLALPLLLLLLLQDFDSQGLAKLAFGLASVGYDDDALYTAITQAATQQLDSMSPTDVSMILWACGEQGHLCDKFMSGKGHAWAAMCRRKLAALPVNASGAPYVHWLLLHGMGWSCAVFTYHPSSLVAVLCLRSSVLQLLQTTTCLPTWQTSCLSSCRFH
jgi:hypothetical protein